MILITLTGESCYTCLAWHPLDALNPSICSRHFCVFSVDQCYSIELFLMMDVICAPQLGSPTAQGRADTKRAMTVNVKFILQKFVHLHPLDQCSGAACSHQYSQQGGWCGTPLGGKWLRYPGQLQRLYGSQEALPTPVKLPTFL